VTCEFDADMEAEFPTNMSGKLTIQAGNRTFEQSGGRSERRTVQLPDRSGVEGQSSSA